MRTAEAEEEEEEEEKELPPTFALAAKRVRAFDLSCRACGACGAGAGCWAWIPGWETLGFHPQPPIRFSKVIKILIDFSKLCHRRHVF